MISVAGLGKLGVCIAGCMARGGYGVLGADVDENRVAELARGHVAFPEPGLTWLIEETRDSLAFTADVAQAVRDSDLTFITVPTPSIEDGSLSGEYVQQVLETVSAVLKEKAAFHVVAVVSTVMPGMGDGSFISYLERTTEKQVGKHFGYAYTPDFVSVGSVVADYLTPGLVLIGESDPRTGDRLEEIFMKVCDNQPPVLRSSVTDAEIAKLAIAGFCTMKISFANNLAEFCERMEGTNAERIAEIIGQDPRVGGRCLRPGIGFGGPALPRENDAFIRFVAGVGGYAGLQRAVVNINEGHGEWAAARILAALGEKSGAVALLGQSYRAGTCMTERSQALDIARLLAESGAVETLRVYDPMAHEDGPWERSASLEECVRGAEVAAVLTPWPEFFPVSGWRDLLAEGGRVVNFWRGMDKGGLECT